MEKENKSLSEKIVYVGQIDGKCCKIKDVKEFIKDLKKVCGCGNCKQYVHKDIDKIAGKELI